MDAKRKALEALSTGVMAQTTTQIAAPRASQRRNSLKKMAGTTGLEHAASVVTVQSPAVTDRNQAARMATKTAENR